jgi:predicted AAA+ superfamily ATPase
VASDPSRFAALLDEKLADSAANPIPTVTPRRLVQPALFLGKATAVIGMRRAGKTFFLHQLRGERARAGTPRAHLPYVNFEDERLAGLEPEHLSLLIEAFYRRYPGLRQGSEPVLWCLDEIQVVPGWERFVRRILDTESVEVVLTGSSAALLSQEIATTLRGRAWSVLVHPFAFDEVLRHAGEAVPDVSVQLGARARSSVEGAFLAWLDAGGFPEVQGQPPAVRHRLLRDYVDVAILRDVVERHEVGNVTALRWLVRHLLGNAAGSFSVERFHGALKTQGIAVGRDTLHALLAHLQDCFLVRALWMESSSERQRMVNPRKVYPVDPGLIPIFDRTGRANLGHALETAVLLELERRRAEVTWVRTAEGHEVDFYARFPSGQAELVQVSADTSDPFTAARELRALAEALPAFPGATARLLTATQAGLPRDLPDGVLAEPAWRWILRTAT